MTLFDLSGWIGGISVAVGYVFVTLHLIDPAGRAYQLLNIAGGVMLTVTALYRLAYPNMIINLVWIVFGVYALLRTLRGSAGDDLGSGSERVTVEQGGGPAVQVDGSAGGGAPRGWDEADGGAGRGC